MRRVRTRGPDPRPAGKALATEVVPFPVGRPGTFYCYACLRSHEKDSEIGRDHRRYDIDADAATSMAQAHLREFYLQTKGIAAALTILGFEGVRIHPPRFGQGWPTREAIERRFRDLVRRHHPDAGGDPDEFRRIRWAIGVLRRYRPPDEYRAGRA